LAEEDETVEVGIEVDRGHLVGVLVGASYEVYAETRFGVPLT
jgi:hypothetical protein